MTVKVGDRVTVLGMPGVHVVKEIADVLYPAHKSALIVLGCAYGRQVAGETRSVELWRCHVAPVDLEDFPRGA